MAALLTLIEWTAVVAGACLLALAAQQGEAGGYLLAALALVGALALRCVCLVRYADSIAHRLIRPIRRDPPEAP